MTNYVDGINVENCNKLLEWLDAGAPTAVFRMEYASILVKDLVDDNHDAEWEDLIIEEANEKGVGMCGTVCCIGGAAAALSKGDISAHVDYGSYGIIDDIDGLFLEAMNFLGIKKQRTGSISSTYLGHDLFDPDLAPFGCTPRQAAAAVRRVMIGEEAWPDEE